MTSTPKTRLLLGASAALAIVGALMDGAKPKSALARNAMVGQIGPAFEFCDTWEINCNDCWNGTDCDGPTLPYENCVPGGEWYCSPSYPDCGPKRRYDTPCTGEFSVVGYCFGTSC